MTVIKTGFVKSLCLSVVFLCISCILHAQQAGTTEQAEMFSLDLKDLLSKRQEKEISVEQSNTLSLEKNNVVDEIYNIHVLSKEELRASGALSIPEALRYIPNVLVKQVSTGIYEVSLHTDGTMFSEFNPIGVQNTPVMVMVDFVPINHAYNHQIIWENIPVDMSAIKQIEVITSGQPILYGGEAISGVIHIITSSDTEKSILLQGGTQRNLHASARLPVQLSKKVNLAVEGHFKHTDRNENLLYYWNDQRYTSADSSLLYQPNANQTNLYSTLSLRSMGARLSLHYQMNEKSYLKGKVGVNMSDSYMPWLYIDQLSNTRRLTNSYQGSLVGKLNNTFVLVHYKHEDIDFAEGYESFAFRNQRLHTQIKQLIHVTPRLQLTPLLSVHYDRYSSNETGISDQPYGVGLMEPSARIEFAGGVNAMMLLNTKLSAQLGARVNKTNLTSQAIQSYQFGFKQLIKEKNFLRLALSVSHISPVLEAWKVNRAYTNQIGANISFLANEELSLTQVRKLQLDYDISVFKNSIFSLSLFGVQVKNPILQSNIIQGDNQTLQFINLAQSVSNIGAASAFHLKLDKLLFNVFVTCQKGFSDEENYAEAFNPSLFGGATVSTKLFTDKLGLFSSVYFASQTNTALPLWDNSLAIRPLFNFKIDYRVWKNAFVYLNIKEFNAQQQYQYQFGDFIPSRFLIGGSIHF